VTAHCAGTIVTNPTAFKFGFPQTLVAETAHWLVLVRAQQVTYGALVLVAKSEATAFSDLPPAAFTDLKAAVDGIETLLRATVAYARINYLMLMMVDPHVHFHVIPRYEGERQYAGHTLVDAGWPGAPALASHIALSEDEAGQLAADFTARWPG
jgi:diadenosine tetraphosphate (Ap4A) HIT family hydrolase